ncbi:SRP40, carboxy-terminal domain protein [Rhizoctonia solani]|uniref:SRP40, carboxy-terminal domain protein n=1 Tax=Rhizoctonia solani TaxID=456999 RepID=A0A8H8NPX4_9AGAM|nr:SRP40, carboxy-terminal domain protein [Rhizoctonia solani]QRW16440.1 SRP40, carboxy-terminal domain protein [Rhizoctonia solani]
MSRLPDIYRAVHAFLLEQGHTKAAQAVRKAALPVVDVDAASDTTPKSLVEVYSTQAPVPSGNPNESVDHSSSSDDSSSSSSEDEAVASPKKVSIVDRNKPGATNGAAKASAKTAKDSNESSSSEDDSSEESSSSSSNDSNDSSDSDSSDSDSDSSSDEGDENEAKSLPKPAVDSKVKPATNGVAKPTVNGKSKAKESDSSSGSSSPSSSEESESSSEDDSGSESSSESSSSESESESEPETQPAAKKRKVDATSSVPVPATTTTKTKTTTVATTPETVTLTKSTTTSTTTSTDGTNGKNGKQKGPRKPVVPFSRIKADDVVYADPRLMNNSFDSKGGTINDYGERASRDLIVTRGAGFRKEKNKKKRGSYRGGEITSGLGEGFGVKGGTGWTIPTPALISFVCTADLLTRVPTSDAEPFHKVHLDLRCIRGVGFAISTYGAK